MDKIGQEEAGMWHRRGMVRALVVAWLTGRVPPLRAQGGVPAPSVPHAWRAPLGRVVVAVEQKMSLCYLPLTVAERLGYFAAEGLDVQVREFAEPGQAMQGVLTGVAQVAVCPYSQTVALQLRDQVMRAFVLLGRAPQLVLGVSQHVMVQNRQLTDLRGRRLGVSALGGAGHRMARLVLARAGLGPQDVQYLAISSPSQAAAAFRSGQVDALCYHDPVMTQLEQAGELRVVVDTRTLGGTTEVFGGPLPSGSLCAAADFLDDNPQQCQALANALVRALKWLQTAGPSDLHKTLPEAYFQGDRALYMAAFGRARESWTPDGLMPDGAPQTTLRLLAQFGDAQQLRRVDLAQTYTNRFAEVAKARYRA